MPQDIENIEDLITHSGPMRLLDRLIEASGEQGVAEVRISENSVFYRPGKGVPAYVGIEYMAQAVAAYNGAMRRKDGLAPAMGYLLGTRHYQADRDWFVGGDHLLVRTGLLFQDVAMASFDCRIEIGGVEAASATLTVYQPEPEVRS